jgi:hypothetical protein
MERITSLHLMRVRGVGMLVRMMTLLEFMVEGENGVESGEIELMQSGGTPSSCRKLGVNDLVQEIEVGVLEFLLLVPTCRVSWRPLHVLIS